MEPQYAVVAFPALDGADSVEAIRRQFDPLATVLGAHITLVFPFQNDVGESGLLEHVSGVAHAMPPFAMSLADISVESDRYLFLNVGAGADSFHELHARLHSGPLGRYRSATHEYRPHVTIGRFTDLAQLEEARRGANLSLALPLLGSVDSLSLFRLDEPARGSVVVRVPLGYSRLRDG